MIPHIKSKNQGIKKTISSSQQQKSLLSMGFKKQQTITYNQYFILISIQDLLKYIQIQQIIYQCPKVKQLFLILTQKSFIPQKLVYHCLDKYFHGYNTSLWINKYAPRLSNQLLQNDFSNKIQQWIKDFYYFGKENNDNDDSLQQSYSKSLQCRMKQYGWNCRALLLKGRSGVGKTSLLTAIAKSMNIKCFQYASDVDQHLKLKQLIQGSQSQVITNIQNKKKQYQNNKIIKSHNPITKFISPPSQKSTLQTKQPKRLQIFRNFSLYYPSLQKSDRQNASDNYYRCLFDKINKSQIPYILTTDKQQFIFRQKQLHQKFQKFDQIQFVQNTIEQLTYLYWVIYHIQTNLSLNTTKKIKKQNLIQQLNTQLNSLKLTCQDNTHLIRQLIINSNKKLLYISKYLQFRTLPKTKPLDQDQQPTKNQVLQQCIHDIGYQILNNITSQDLIYNIDWQLYQRNYDDTNPLQQTAAQDLYKYQKYPDLDPKIDQDLTSKKPNLKQIINMLQLNIVYDKKCFYNQYCEQPKNYKQHHYDPFTTIPTYIVSLSQQNTHSIKKKSISKHKIKTISTYIKILSSSIINKISLLSTFNIYKSKIYPMQQKNIKRYYLRSFQQNYELQINYLYEKISQVLFYNLIFYHLYIQSLEKYYSQYLQFIVKFYYGHQFIYKVNINMLKFLELETTILLFLQSHLFHFNQLVCQFYSYLKEMK